VTTHDFEITIALLWPGCHPRLVEEVLSEDPVLRCGSLNLTQDRHCVQFLDSRPRLLEGKLNTV
ncbi:hypothetical protein KKA47_03670, partial [bacterium]|nr:hypothetical protein [bacterium]